MQDGVMAMVSVEPDHAGPVTLDIRVMDKAGIALTAQGVEVTVSAPSLGIEPIRRVRARRALARPRFVASRAGRWRFELDIRKSRFEFIKLAGDAPIP